MSAKTLAINNRRRDGAFQLVLVMFSTNKIQGILASGLALRFDYWTYLLEA